MARAAKAVPSSSTRGGLLLDEHSSAPLSIELKPVALARPAMVIETIDQASRFAVGGDVGMGLYEGADTVRNEVNA